MTTMDNPFSGNYLRTVPGPGEVFGPFAIAFVVVFAIGFLASVALYNGLGRGVFPNSVMFRMARKWGGWGVVVFGLGLFFFAIRALQINPFGFGRRAWLWICILIALAWIGWILADLKRNYQSALEQYQEHIRKREYAKATSTLLSQGAANFKGAPNVPISRPVRKRRR
jgi:ABC-type transport system involved in multi-copper enzyme maturation permease subunit